MSGGQSVSATVSVTSVGKAGSAGDNPGSLAGSGGSDPAGGGGGGGFGRGIPGGFGGCSSCAIGGRNGFTGVDGGDKGGGMLFNLRAGSLIEGLLGPDVSFSAYPTDGTVDPEDVDVLTQNGRLTHGAVSHDRFGIPHNAITQVVSSQAIVNILTNGDANGTAYLMQFYKRSDAAGSALDGQPIPITPTASPFATWLVDSKTGEVKVNKYLAGGLLSQTLDYLMASNSVTLTIDGSSRIEKTVISWDIPNATRTEVSTISGGIIPVNAYQTTRVYQQFPYTDGAMNPQIDEVMIQETVGSGPNALVTQYFYYPSVASVGSFKPLQLVVYPDQSWKYFVYYAGVPGGPQVISDVYSGIGDTPNPGANGTPVEANCRHVHYSYASVDPNNGDDGSAEPYTARKVTESWRGHVVSQSFAVITPTQKTDYACVDLTESGPTLNDLKTVTTLGVDNRVVSIQHPDGTLTLFDYQSFTDGSLQTTEWNGAPNTDGTAVIDGTKTVTIINSASEVSSQTVTDIASSQVTLQDTFTMIDDFQRYLMVGHLNGRTDLRTFDCCGVDTWTDQDGVQTAYAYDDLHRLYATTRLNITNASVLDSAGNSILVYRVGDGELPKTLRTPQYDLAGRLISDRNALAGTTAIVDAVSPTGRVRTTTFPDLGTSVETYYLDGNLKSVTGTAVAQKAYVYDVEQDQGDPTNLPWRRYTLVTQLDATGAPTSQTTKTYIDGLDRIYREVNADNTFKQATFNSLGQLSSVSDEDGVTALFSYNARGEQDTTAVEMTDATHSAHTQPDKLGLDRMTQTVTDVFNGSHGWVHRAQTYVWTANNSDSPLLVSDDEMSLDGLQFWSTSLGRNVQSSMAFGTGGARTLTTTAPDTSTAVSQFVNGRLISVTRNIGSTSIGQATYAYDPEGRLFTVTDARNGPTTFGYNNADQVVSVTTPSPGNGQNAQTTTSFNDTLGQVIGTLLPDNTTVTNLLTLRGEQAQVNGSREYPTGFGYDPQGRMKTMTNWTGFAASAGVRVTTWNYDSQRGWLNSKTYDGNTAGPSYGHTSAGRLSSRSWARGANTVLDHVGTGQITGAGDVQTVTYSDNGITAPLANGYDRRGRLMAITNGATVCTLTYNDANELMSEAYTGGPLNGMTVNKGYDTLLRRQSTTVLHSGATVSSSTYGYDGASRLQTVTDGGGNSANYTYVPNSSLVDQIAFKQSGTTRATTINQYDLLNRLLSRNSGTNASYSYQYNNANQRTRMTLGDGSYWSYGYDTLGQLTSGKKYWVDGTPVAGEQFGNSFDDIGNRTSTLAGGDSAGGSLRSATYTADNLNHYSSRTVPGAVDITGLAFATASVTVNGNSAARKGEYYDYALPVNNASAPVWQSVTVQGTSGANSSSDTGNIFVPKATEAYTYDLDGNLYTDGRFGYTWDGENRPINITSIAGAPTASLAKLDLTYDYAGRRIQKIVSNNNGTAYVVQSTRRFVYDGWNLLAVLDQNNTLLYSFDWGSDLSGTMQGAGGVGGLVSMTVSSGANAGTYFYCYDGNGNVMALVNAANGSLAAQYEYGPFGELIRATGPMAFINPFRFSTKYQDDETGFLYYGYRYYNPSTGRWLSRDPIGEAGCVNLYACVKNEALNLFDALGLEAQEGLGAYFKRKFNDFVEKLFSNPWSPPTGGQILGAGVDNIVQGIFRTAPMIDYELANNPEDTTFRPMLALHIYDREHLDSASSWADFYLVVGTLATTPYLLQERAALSPTVLSADSKCAIAATETRVPISGDAGYIGPVSKGWTLAADGQGAHLVERVNVIGRPKMAALDQASTPRYYPMGTPESAGAAHVRLHRATKAAGIPLRQGRNAALTDAELIQRYKQAYSDPSISGIRGDLRTPNGSSVIATDVSPGVAFDGLLDWLFVQ